MNVDLLALTRGREINQLLFNSWQKLHSIARLKLTSPPTNALRSFSSPQNTIASYSQHPNISNSFRKPPRISTNSLIKYGRTKYSSPLSAIWYFHRRITSSPHFQSHAPTKPSKLINFLTNVVPGSSQRFLDKSRSLAADCVAYDLEDSVTPHMKAEARGLVRRAIDQPTPAGIRERAVRINSVDSGLALGDLTEVVSLIRALREYSKKKGKRTRGICYANNALHCPAPITKSFNNRDSKGQLSFRPYLRNGRDLPHTCSTIFIRSIPTPNLPPRSSRIRQIPHKPRPNLRRIASPPRSRLCRRGLRSRSKYHTNTIINRIPLRTLGNRNSRTSSQSSLNNRSCLYNIQVR